MVNYNRSMTEFINKKGEFIGVVENFTDLSPEQQELVQEMAHDASEASVQMQLAEESGNGIHTVGAKDVITHNLLRRALYATTQGLNEQQIVAAVDHGFKYKIKPR